MATIIEFPVSRRLGTTTELAPLETVGTILILPVIRIERHAEETNGDRGPEQGTATGRRRRRR
ncbi:MAG TPA: hypothetical protein VKY22_05445 [Bradyrhizobium sp.]|jgi:hypothetical protein|nr:hypothetical protein [Bradyrhizobium sp.]